MYQSRTFSSRLIWAYSAVTLPAGSNGSELEPKKKKKRSYANAYTRKGEGLAAAINSMKPVAIDIKIETTEGGIEVPRKKRTKRKPKGEMAAEGSAEEVQALKAELKEPVEAIVQVLFELAQTMFVPLCDTEEVAQGFPQDRPELKVSCFFKPGLIANKS